MLRLLRRLARDRPAEPEAMEPGERSEQQARADEAAPLVAAAQAELPPSRPAPAKDDRALAPPADGTCLLAALPPTLLMAAYSFITYSSQGLRHFERLSRGMREVFDDETLWQHLCADYWFIAEEARLKQWPSNLSCRGLYHTLEQWAALEGFYNLPAAFPWSLLVLVHFDQGTLVADTVRFRSVGGESVEHRTRLFEVSFSEDAGSHSIRSTISFPKEVAGLHGVEASIAPLPPGRIMSALPWQAVPQWFSSRRGFSLELPPQKARPRAAEQADDDEDLPAGFELLWAPDYEAPESSGPHMVLEMLQHTRSLPFSLVRGPTEYTLDDPAAPHLKPGLYVGEYQRRLYGQFANEVVLVEYVECGSAAELADIYGEPSVPQELLDLLLQGGADDTKLSFLLGTKVTGDVHVPCGQKTFVAVLSPPGLRRDLERGRSGSTTQILNRATHELETVRNSWPAHGMLAFPGFQNPSWSQGQLLQLASEHGDRFGFMWNRQQDVIVLAYVPSQQHTGLFLDRRWLPEDLR